MKPVLDACADIDDAYFTSVFQDDDVIAAVNNAVSDEMENKNKAEAEGNILLQAYKSYKANWQPWITTCFTPVMYGVMCVPSIMSCEELPTQQLMTPSMFMSFALVLLIYGQSVTKAWSQSQLQDTDKIASQLVAKFRKTVDKLWRTTFLQNGHILNAFEGIIDSIPENRTLQEDMKLFRVMDAIVGLLRMAHECGYVWSSCGHSIELQGIPGGDLSVDVEEISLVSDNDVLTDLHDSLILALSIGMSTCTVRCTIPNELKSVVKIDEANLYDALRIVFDVSQKESRVVILDDIFHSLSDTECEALCAMLSQEEPFVAVHTRRSIGNIQSYLDPARLERTLSSIDDNNPKVDDLLRRASDAVRIRRIKCR